MTKTTLHSLLLSCLLGTLFGCGPEAGGDSNTHWLTACSDDTQCGSLICNCGVCTMPCEGDDACVERGPGAVCAPAEVLACSSVFGVCTVSCMGDDDCADRGGATRCHTGRCVPPDAVDSDAGGMGGTSGSGGTGTGGVSGSSGSGGNAGTGAIDGGMSDASDTDAGDGGILDSDGGDASVTKFGPAFDCDWVNEHVVHCGSDVGDCSFGRLSCPAGQLPGMPPVCVGAVGPASIELCDDAQRDEDCDGSANEGCPCAGDTAPCGTTGDGVCNLGVAHCATGVRSMCTMGVEPALDVTCDGVDLECSGTARTEHCAYSDVSCVPGETRPCGIEEGACSIGEQQCEGGAFGACSGVAPANEVCMSGLDEDCDSHIDEADCAGTAAYADCLAAHGPILGQLCINHIGGACNGSQHYVCDQAGQLICNGPFPQLPEQCGNGVDDDCSGIIDDNCPCNEGAQGPCSNDIGACQAGIAACMGGVWVCGGVLPQPEICDNAIDDDCDGFADEPPCSATIAALGPACGELTDETGPVLATVDARPSSLVDAGDYVYFVLYGAGSSRPPELKRVSIAGGTPEHLRNLGDPQDRYEVFAVTPTDVWLTWSRLDSGSIVRAPLDGSPPVNVITPRMRTVRAPMLDGTDVYWIEDSMGFLMRQPIAGGQEEMMTGIVRKILGFDATRVFVATFNDGLRAIDKTTFQATSLAQYVNPLTVGDSPLDGFVNGSEIVWLAEGELRRTPVDGGVTTEVDCVGNATSLTLAGTDVITAACGSKSFVRSSPLAGGVGSDLVWGDSVSCFDQLTAGGTRVYATRGATTDTPPFQIVAINH